MNQPLVIQGAYAYVHDYKPGDRIVFIVFGESGYVATTRDRPQGNTSQRLPDEA